eukprot:scaffold27956_cov129-Isochrysis_galbana.AAC.1
MGDPALYPEIRTARFIYAMQRLPRDFTADVQARQQRVDNNLTYLDGLVLADLHYHDADFRRDSWSTYHNLHMCRLEACALPLGGGKATKDLVGRVSPSPTNTR